MHIEKLKYSLNIWLFTWTKLNPILYSHYFRAIVKTFVVKNIWLFTYRLFLIDFSILQVIMYW